MQNDSDGYVAPPSSRLPKEESNTSLLGAMIDDEEELPAPPPSSPVEPVSVNPGRPPLPPVAPPALSPSPPLGRRRKKSDVSDVSTDGFQHHRRGASWDSENVAEAIKATKRESDIPPTKKHIITVSDLNNISPMEAEAETMIFKALEEKKDQPHIVRILSGVPDDAVTSFEEVPDEVPKEIRPSGLSRFQAAADKVRSANAGTKNELAKVASAMRLLHENSSSAKDSKSRQSNDQAFDSELLPPTEEDISATSNADVLLQNANILFRRLSTKRGPLLSISEEDKNKDDLSNDVELGGGGLTKDSHDHNDKNERQSKVLRMKSMMKQARSRVDREFNLVKSDFIEPNKANIVLYFKVIMGFIISPLVIMAAILFYGVGNPDLGKEGATISWFLLFLVRQVITFTIAKASEIYVIDYLSLKKRFTVRVFGPSFALFVVQSKGYPCVVFLWAVYSFMLLSGKNHFAKHWLFYQPYIDMCNENNNAGTITESDINYRVLSSALIFGVAVALKRLWLGLALGRRTYNNYGTKLAKIMHSVLLVSEVATLSKRGQPTRKSREFTERSVAADWSIDFGASGSVVSQQEVSRIEALGAEQFYGNLNMSQHQLVNDHLGEWEEPEVIKKKPDDTSITAILQFRQALTFVDNVYPFSYSFGPANKRSVCIESGQKVYEHLLLRQSSEEDLHFNVIAELAIERDGSMDSEKMKELVRLFRPDREGILTMIDFLKSVDNVYKEFRLIQASIENSGSVDRAFEMMVNYGFFTILWCVLLFICGIDPFKLFVSLSAFVVGFAFMIGGASSKYFEGILFILVRRPYDIGDRIHVSNPENDTLGDGSMTWFVEDLGLYSTTVRFAATNEVATYSNGSLASSRIINAARSPLASVSVYMKFGVNVSYEKVQTFKKTVERFVKDRPREWVSLTAFRAAAVEQDLGFIKYSIALQHRESWQNISAILNSKAEVTSFSLEVAKQLGLRYTAPPLPVNLNLNPSQAFDVDTERGDREDAGNEEKSVSSGFGAIASMFQQMQK